MWGIFQRSLLFHGILAVLVICIGIRSYQMVHDALGMRRTLDESQKKMGTLIQKKHVLDASIAELDTPEAAERIAKERLNLKKRGEEVVVVPPVASSSPVIPAADTRMWWQKIFSLFSH